MQRAAAVERCRRRVAAVVAEVDVLGARAPRVAEARVAVGVVVGADHVEVDAGDLRLRAAAALGRARGDEVEHLLHLVARQVHRGDRVLEREHVVHLLEVERARLEVGADAERVGEREVGLDALAQAHRGGDQVAELRVAAVGDRCA